MLRSGRTTTAVCPVTNTEWSSLSRKEFPSLLSKSKDPSTEKEVLPEIVKKEGTNQTAPAAPAAPAAPTVTSVSKTGGFYEKQTFWQQELHRYELSWWLPVRVGSLIAFPYIMSALGHPVWSWVESMGMATETMAPPMITILTFTGFLAHNALYGILYHFDTITTPQEEQQSSISQPQQHANSNKLIAFFHQYRIDDKPWHWDIDPDGWNDMLRHTMSVVLFNFFGMALPLSCLNACFMGTPLRLDVGSLPSGGEMLWQLLFCLFWEDLFFHHAHQLLHTKRFYWIHKIHHQYHAPISISAVYAHPLEYLFGNIIPSLVGPMIFLRQSMHAWSFCIWLVFRVSGAVENHSGYEFPWSMYQAIPFKAPTEYHDFHHNRNLGTYSGVLRFWDMVYGSNAQYFEWVQMGRPEVRRKTKQSKKQESKKAI